MTIGNGGNSGQKSTLDYLIPRATTRASGEVSLDCCHNLCKITLATATGKFPSRQRSPK